LAIFEVFHNYITLTNKNRVILQKNLNENVVIHKPLDFILSA